MAKGDHCCTVKAFKNLASGMLKYNYKQYVPLTQTLRCLEVQDIGEDENYCYQQFYIFIKMKKFQCRKKHYDFKYITRKNKKYLALKTFFLFLKIKNVYKAVIIEFLVMSVLEPVFNHTVTHN